MPDLVLPPPAPQSEAEGAKNPDTPPFSFAPNPVTGYVGGGPDPEQGATRVHPDLTTHPTTKKWTKNPQNRSR